MKKIFALILGVSASLGWFINSALPVFATDTIGSAVYLDTDSNGAIDTIRWTFSDELDVTACAYEAGDWAVNTAGDMAVVITGLECAGVNPYLNILVSADANETGLQTGAGNNPVVSYTDAAPTGGSVVLTSGSLGEHASIPTTDGAKPIIKTSVFGISGSYQNQLLLTYSEVLMVSNDGGGDSDIAIGDSATSTSTLGSMTTAKTLTGLATWDGTSDMTQNAVTDNRVTLGSNGLLVTVAFNNISAGYFNAGSTAPTTPTVTPIEDATDVTDLNDNPVNSSQTPVLSTYTEVWDITAPTVSNTYSCDTDADGDIDVVQLDFDDNMRDSSFTAGSLELDNDVTNNAVGEETVLAVSSTTSGCDASAIDADAGANDDILQLSLTTGISGTNSAYFHHVTAGIRDAAGNRMATGAALGTEVDAANPLLSASTPADADDDVSRSGSFTLTFTEPINTGTFIVDLAPYSGALPVTWSGGDSIATVNPSSTLTGNTDYAITITTANDLTPNAYGGGAPGVTEPINFTTASSSSSSGGSSAAATYEVTLTEPTGGETLTPGEDTNITWTTGGTGNISYVNLYYSLDGSTFTSIAAGTINDSSYTWTVPDADTATAEIRIEATDLASALDTDTSAAFTIGDVETADTATDENVAPGSDVFGNSPSTGEIEEISALNIGDYIRAESFDTVYYMDASSTRRPFSNSSIFFTWQTDFSDVLTVTDATLPVYSLGAPMLPKPGVVLMKIVSNPKVYAIEADPSDSNKAIIRWVPDEATATAVYGSDWADYVIDVDVTLFARFTKGTDITSSYDANLSIMKKRVDLH